MNHGWEIKKWNDVLSIINGKNQNAVENPDGPYPIYGSGGIMSYADDYLCPEECTIIGRKGSINNPIFVPTKFWNVDTAFGICPQTDILNPKFLYYFCVQYDFLRHNKATTLPSLVKSDLLKIKMALPSMNKQIAIVAELDKINEMIEANQALLGELDALAQSLFYDTFGDPITNPKGWEINRFGQLCETGSGGTPSKANSIFWDNGTIPWIGSNMCQNKIVYKTDGKCITQSGLENSAAKLLPKNSVIIALVGATIGKAGLLKTETAINQNVAFAKPSENISPVYLFYCLQGLYALFLEIGNGKFKMANLGFIRDLQIPLPPLALQNQFASQIEAIERQKAEVEATIAELQTLLDSRMDYWFND